MVPTRRQTLAAAGALLTGLSGCSGGDETTPTATAGEQEFGETVEDPVSRTVRNPDKEAAVRSTVASSWSDRGWTRWLVADQDDREALYFADAADGVDAAVSLLDDTDFSSELVIVHQHTVKACEEWSLERLRWGAADDGAPSGSAAVRLQYRDAERETDCKPDAEDDVAATFVRVPARFERVTQFGFGVS